MLAELATCPPKLDGPSARRRLFTGNCLRLAVLSRGGCGLRGRSFPRVGLCEVSFVTEPFEATDLPGRWRLCCDPEGNAYTTPCTVGNLPRAYAVAWRSSGRAGRAGMPARTTWHGRSRS